MTFTTALKSSPAPESSAGQEHADRYKWVALSNTTLLLRPQKLRLHMKKHGHDVLDGLHQLFQGWVWLPGTT